MPKHNTPKLPKWFNRAHYIEKTRNRDAKFWLTAISRRIKLIEDIENPKANPEATHYQNELSSRLIEIASLESHGKASKVSISGVTHPTMGAFNSIWEQINSREDYKTLCNPQDIDDPTFFSLYERSISTLFDNEVPPTHNSCLFAQVDLAFSDKKIKEDFDSWLKTCRRHKEPSQPPMRLSESTFRRWHENMLLPYIDLVLWSRLTHGSQDQQWSCEDYEEMLFPDHVQDRVRRTVKPGIKELLSWETLRELLLISSP